MVVLIVTSVIVFHFLNWASSDFVSKLLQVEISEFIDFEIWVAKVLFIKVSNQLNIFLENLVSLIVFVIGCIVFVVYLYEMQEFIMNVRRGCWNDQQEDKGFHLIILM